jgi:hypothetical protein
MLFCGYLPYYPLSANANGKLTSVERIVRGMTIIFSLNLIPFIRNCNVELTLFKIKELNVPPQ